MSKSRRDFLKLSALASGMLFVPNFLHASQGMGLLGNSNGRRLVVIQLSGGNDGLNTVIPFEDDLYYKARPSLAINSGKVLQLQNGLGFHPSLDKMRQLYDQGFLTVMNSVGYPNPDRSHFRSTDIWHTASASDEYLKTGWLGRYLDSCCTGSSAAHMALEIDDSLSLALKGEKYNGMAVQDVRRFYQASQDRFLKQMAKTHHHDAHEHHQVDYLYKTLINSQQSAEYLHQQVRAYRSNQEYPKGEFSKNLKTIAELITSGVESRVYYASLSGFDTHIRQEAQQARLLQELSEGLYSFVQDLRQHQAFDDTLIVVFSEFGRRVNQNASNGTDHGTANNLFLIGGKLQKAGIYNAAPNLADLDAGDLKHQIDFRNIYATLLQNWMQADAGAVLGGSFKALDKLV
ncbi:uncharacterized protein (DUF1501 family) [Pontibacter aydingkolensis]|uniref:DUF1501 domain-containing protein n=1 Tax=Pontibacter aydingkolensis TaxID=1911536 RepID=A0ABS7CXG0_9BACT|nr:DUF1501 domain-containing protein [Pontibacter aydingkolensis]MBW7468391.1 DUF1501 domain-containing protein [Pontibacter aydingkolensis]